MSDIDPRFYVNGIKLQNAIHSVIYHEQRTRISRSMNQNVFSYK